MTIDIGLPLVLIFINITKTKIDETMRLNSIAAKKNIGMVIKERRIKKRISQSELCTKANISQTFLSLVEHGKRVPSKDVLQQIAKALGENANNLEKEAGIADTDSIVKLDALIKKIAGSGNQKKLARIVEFIETLG